jgi:hypothetical protein
METAKFLIWFEATPAVVATVPFKVVVSALEMVD